MIEVEANSVKKAYLRFIIGGLLQLAMMYWLFTEYGVKHSALWLIATILGFTFGDKQVFDIMRPVGLMMLCGAFMFGIGMQLAGSCTSGSMCRSGSGQFRLWFSLVGIITGAFFAAKAYGEWSKLPIYFVYSYQREFSWPIALLIQFAILASLWKALSLLEFRWNGSVVNVFDSDHQRSSMASINKKRDVNSIQLKRSHTLLFGNWSLGFGSIVLAFTSVVALIILSRPWVISIAFPFWATKLSVLAGFEFDFEFWDYWGIPQNEAMLSQGWFENVTSLMNIAFILGATFGTISLIRSTVKNKWAFSWKDSLLLPVITFAGGVLMGYGAVIGLGCNIGGFLSAVLSGSVHGWVWVGAALVGSVVGIYLRKALTL